MVTQQRPEGWCPPWLTDPLTHSSCPRHAGTDMQQDPQWVRGSPAFQGGVWGRTSIDRERDDMP